jgi:hypothetical protein
MGVLTAVASFLGDALLVPVSEVGSLAVGAGWMAACAAYLAWTRRGAAAARARSLDRALAVVGVVVGAGIVLMKVVPAVPGSFGAAEWIAFGGWVILGLAFWAARGRETPAS